MPHLLRRAGAAMSVRRRLASGRCCALAAAALIALSSPGLAVAASDSEALAGRPLLAALKAGGMVLYFRHTSTDFGQNDEQMTGYEDCARQRNLTERGRAEALAIGTAIKRFSLPVSEVLASPFCRTLETARLIFGRATATAAVRGGPANEVTAERYAELRKLLSSAPPTGTDVAIVSHGNPFRAVTGEAYLAEGEAAVIRPLGAAGFRIVARIPKDGWDSLGAP